MGLLCAVFKPFEDIFQQSFAVYHGHDQNSCQFNPVYQTIAVNQPFPYMLVVNLWYDAA